MAVGDPAVEVVVGLEVHLYLSVVLGDDGLA